MFPAPCISLEMLQLQCAGIEIAEQKEEDRVEEESKQEKSEQDVP